MSNDSKRDSGDHEREIAELWEQVLTQELRHRRHWRDIFETHEKVIGAKVRQLRTERQWSQDDLAEKLDSMGWPLGQMTISRLEAGTRPIRVADIVALAQAFGLPPLALWYLPVTGEPWSIAAMRRRLAEIDDYIAGLKSSLDTTIGLYADGHFERERLVEALNDAANSAERGDLEDLDLDAEETR